MHSTEIFDTYYAELNAEQKQAVDTLEGAIMVIAGPGTGKTQIIGLRTANIILKTGVSPYNILITTFTEAGVIAIRERLRQIIGAEAYKVQVSTIHSFAQDVIKTFPEKFTQEKLDTPVDEIESLEMIHQIVEELITQGLIEHLTSYGDKMFYVRDIAASINNLKREGVTPQIFEKKIEEENTKSLVWLEEKRNNKRIKNIEKYEKEHESSIGKLKELLLIYTQYQKALRERHLYDFNDMINFVLEKFRDDSDLRYHYAEKFQYIMLDEYQDTNNPQNEIIDIILTVQGEISDGQGSGNIMVVGDDDQSIYRFQGANIENMLDFKNTYPDSKIIVLEKNYRSVQGILDSAKNLIEQNSERLINRIGSLEKNIISQKSENTTPTLYIGKTILEEHAYILDEIQKKLSESIAPSEIAIIVRNNREVQEFSEFLKENDIMVTSKLENNILESDYVIMLLKVLSLIANPYSNDAHLIDVMRSDLVDIQNTDIIKLNQALYKKNYARSSAMKLQIFDVIQDQIFFSEAGVEKSEKFHTFFNQIQELQSFFSQHNILLGLSQLFDTFSLIEFIEKNGDFDDIEDVYTFFTQVKKFVSFNSELTLEGLLRKIELYQKYNFKIQRQILRGKEGGVQVMTAHSSKGLEYDSVFIPHLISGNWDEKTTRRLIKLPDAIAGSGLQFELLDELSDKEKKDFFAERQRQEDRRLFFVALTRAKNTLSLSYHNSVENKICIASSFLSEIGIIDEIPTRNYDEQIEIQAKKELLQESKLVSYDSLELEYIEDFFRNYRLSPSDLNTFLENPKDFLYRTVFRYPFIGNENSIFGTMYHRTLELFYKQILETGKTQDYSYLEFVFLRQLERELLTSEERERLKKRGLESLKGYYETYKGSFHAPLKTEYKFSRKNIFFEDIPLTGIIDKIELVSEDFSANSSGRGSLFSQRIRITDYKTGAIKYMGELKGQDKDGNKLENYEKGKYGRQLLFYKLLFENDSEMNNQYEIASLELDFCEGKNGNYKRVEVEFSQEEFEDFKKLVSETWKKMTDRDFWKEYLTK